MKTAEPHRVLRSANGFDRHRFPNVRRMLFNEPGGSFSQRQLVSPGRRYFLSARAAELVEVHPQVMLYDRLFNHNPNGITVYQVKGEAVCGVEVRPEPTEELVLVYAPEEIPEGIPPKTENVTENYPHPFLPFDLLAGQSLIEERLAAGTHGTGDAIYMGTNPFDVYRGIYLANIKLGAKLAGIKTVLEIGSGLSIISLVISQLMPQTTRVAGIDVDLKLLSHAAQLAKFLERRLGYDVSRLHLHRGDIFSVTGIRVEDFDAVAGWFPLGLDITSDQMIRLFQKLKKDGWVFQMYDDCPLPTNTDNSDKGFRLVEIDAPPPLPINFFQRI